MCFMTKRPNEPERTKPGARTKPRSDGEAAAKRKPQRPAPAVEEIGGREGPDPTRYGDYEKNGRCVDF
jgi:hypothetical protein